MNNTYHFSSGNSPLLISMPHVGIEIPSKIASNMTPEALLLPDVDWHLTLLYDMVKEYDISVLSANYMRYVIDLNRPPKDISLYPGQDTTGLCPVDTFDKQPVYFKGRAPDVAEIQQRIDTYWMPYHAKLALELKRIHDIHGIAILLDAHSIASQVPRFFNGKLPDLNFGTADLQSCDVSLQDAIKDLMINYEKKSIQEPTQTKPYSYVFNGRFKGGYITRNYGIPANNIHSIQLEISQCTYMQEKFPYTYDPTLAGELKPLLSSLIETCIAWANK